jgi:hypothetical protein
VFLHRVNERAERIHPAARLTADYHTAQFLATQLALAERGRTVALLKDLEDNTQAALGHFFREVASHLKAAKAGAWGIMAKYGAPEASASPHPRGLIPVLLILSGIADEPVLLPDVEGSRLIDGGNRCATTAGSRTRCGR